MNHSSVGKEERGIALAEADFVPEISRLSKFTCSSHAASAAAISSACCLAALAAATFSSREISLALPVRAGFSAGFSAPNLFVLKSSFSSDNPDSGFNINKDGRGDQDGARPPQHCGQRHQMAHGRRQPGPSNLNNGLGTRHGLAFGSGEPARKGLRHPTPLQLQITPEPFQVGTHLRSDLIADARSFQPRTNPTINKATQAPTASVVRSKTSGVRFGTKLWWNSSVTFY
jgi:hypothetical protein